jgi:uncharacterized membrane protein YphA (DoxX/SURF4 family)
MSTITANYVHEKEATAISNIERARTILKWTYGLVPIAAGADKFTHILTNWDQYMAPVVTQVIPLQPHTFMSIVGVIEIVAGIILLTRPKLGSIIVGCWLFAIAINLVLTGQYFDIAVRDIVMAIGAFCLHLLLRNENDRGL